MRYSTKFSIRAARGLSGLLLGVTAGSVGGAGRFAKMSNSAVEEVPMRVVRLVDLLRGDGAIVRKRLQKTPTLMVSFVVGAF